MYMNMMLESLFCVQIATFTKAPHIRSGRWCFPHEERFSTIDSFHGVYNKFIGGSDSETESLIHDTGVNTSGTHVGIIGGAQVVSLG